MMKILLLCAGRWQTEDLTFNVKDLILSAVRSVTAKVTQLRAKDDDVIQLSLIFVSVEYTRWSSLGGAHSVLGPGLVKRA